MYTYGTVNSIFVEIQPSSTNIKHAPHKHRKILLSMSTFYNRRSTSVKKKHEFSAITFFSLVNTCILSLTVVYSIDAAHGVATSHDFDMVNDF